MASDPVLLGFDTSAAHCAAAVLAGDRVLAHRVEDMGRGQAERLMPLLSELLAEAGVPVAALTAVAVGIGPGNFTGIRIAVSAARGLALARAIPAIGVTGFDALAEGATGPVLTAIAAPRGRVYLGTPDGPWPEILEPGEMPDQFRGSGLDVIGAEATRLAALTGGQARAPVFPPAEAIVRAALPRIGTPGPRPAPLYLRPADAAPPADPPPVILP